MANNITEVAKEILPNEKLDCVAYGCTSGTVAEGYDSVKKKINLVKPEAKVTTPITSTINALHKMRIKNISVFTPYTESISRSMVEYFKDSGINVKELYYFDIASDVDIGKVDSNYLLEVLSKLKLDELMLYLFHAQLYLVNGLIDVLEKN